MFTAYIDESGNDKTNLLTLGSVVSHGSIWWYFENEWKDCLEKKNLSLVSQGRQALSRYHASDCSTFHNEFAGWSPDEQIEYTKQLLRVFQRNPVHSYAFTLNMDDLVASIPGTKADPKGFGYILLLNYMLREIGERTMALYPQDRISFFYDACDYPGAIAETFAQLKSDDTFKFREQFTSLAPLGWEEDVLLQPADFIAYEAFKEVERQPTPRKRRKSLELVLAMDSFSGVSKSVEKRQMEQIREIVRLQR